MEDNLLNSYGILHTILLYISILLIVNCTFFEVNCMTSAAVDSDFVTAEVQGISGLGYQDGNCKTCTLPFVFKCN